jgi:hypothetical protein
VGDSVLVGVAVQVTVASGAVAVGPCNVAVLVGETVAVLVEVGERRMRCVAVAVAEATGVLVRVGRGVKVADRRGTSVGGTISVAVAVSVGSGVGFTEENSRRQTNAAKPSE